MLNATRVKLFLASPLHTRFVFRAYSLLDNGVALFILLVRQRIWKKIYTYVFTRIYVGTKFAQIGQAAAHEPKVRYNVLRLSSFFC